jgi:glycerophosphoryl diester phosphodiesterase
VVVSVPDVEVVAHRAGNVIGSIASALAVADAIELDVHTFRGRLEVRHAKVLWPLDVRWEPWYLVPAREPRPTLAEILEMVPAGAHLWLDLKGLTPRFARRVLRAVGNGYDLTVSSRSWWVLGPAARRPGVRVMRSVGNRAQRWLVSRRPLRPTTPDPSRRRGIVMHERLADRRTVAELSRGWAPVIAWAVTDLERVRELAALGVDGVIVDDLALIAAIGRRASTRPST